MSVMVSARLKVPASATGTHSMAIVPDMTPKVPQVTTSASLEEGSLLRTMSLNSDAVYTLALRESIFFWTDSSESPITVSPRPPP